MSQKHLEITTFAVASEPKPVSGVQRAVFLFLFLLIPTGLLSAGWFLFSLAPPPEASPFRVGIERFSGPVEIYSHRKKQWRLITRKSQKQIVIKPQDKIRTGKEADIDFKIPGAFDYRLKEDSELQIGRSESGAVILKLERGSFLGLTDGEIKAGTLQIETNQFVSRFQEASFMAHAADGEHSSLDVLEGEMEVTFPGAAQPVSVKAFEHLSVGPNGPGALHSGAVSIRDWKALNEIHDIQTISVQEEKEQIHLREEAGNLFRYVFDEGAFYTPNFGFSKRRFYRDPKTKTVLLRLDYDVYPQASYSGMYLKTRDLDGSKLKRFSFKLRGDGKKPVPDEMRVEFKNKRAVLFGFAVQPKSAEEDLYAFELNWPKPTLISEIAFVFENQKVGPAHLNGAVLMEDLTLE